MFESRMSVMEGAVGGMHRVKRERYTGSRIYALFYIFILLLCAFQVNSLFKK